MPPPLTIGTIEFNDGTRVPTGDADIVVLVGPNNAGKSRTLQEVMAILAHPPYMPFNPASLFAIRSIELKRSLDPHSVTEWLSSHRQIFQEPNTGRDLIRTVGAGNLPLAEVPSHWQPSTMHLGGLAPHMIRLIGPGDARGFIGAANRIEVGAIPDHVLQNLLRQPRLMAAFSKAFRAAFHSNVITDAWGPTIRLRLSQSEEQKDFAYQSPDGMPSPEIAGRLAQLPLIETQSDGVRAFAGLLLALVSVDFPIVLIDEPETFLHPPQARLLGEYLGVLRRDGQLVVATHSLDILLGLLAHQDSRVRVVRLSREEGRTRALTIEPDEVRSVWSDSLLRFSRVLDGLFHEGVVVCEGDTDSLFYSAVTHRITDQDKVDRESVAIATLDDGAEQLSFSNNPFDTMITFAGGKQRIKKACSALQRVRVPVRVIADFDVLNDGTIIRDIIEALGYEYPEKLEALRRSVDAAIRGRETIPTRSSALAAIQRLLSGDDAEDLDSSTARAVTEALRPAQGWALAKRIGAAAVPSGDASANLRTLLAQLAECGLFVVPTGAVESWIKDGHSTGSAWVADVIERELIDHASDAQDFMMKVTESFGARTTV